MARGAALRPHTRHGAVMLTEMWVPIPGFEYRYEVSDRGNVRSLLHKRPLVLRQHIRRHSYLSVRLYSESGIGKRYYAHRLVLEAFSGPCPADHEACHRDGDPQNNESQNLYWGTRQQNIDDIRRHGRNFESNKTHCVNGHEFNPENTRVSNYNGQRICITCCRERSRRYYRNRRLAA